YRRRLPAATTTVHRSLIEVRKQTVVILLQDRIELVIVTAGTAHREAQPHSRGRFGLIEHVLDAVLFRDAPALAVDHVIAIETRGEALLARRFGQKIPGELPDGELIEGEIVVVRLHHPVAPRPHRALAVALVAVAVGVAGRVEPVPGHS